MSNEKTRLFFATRLKSIQTMIPETGSVSIAGKRYCGKTTLLMNVIQSCFALEDPDLKRFFNSSHEGSRISFKKLDKKIQNHFVESNVRSFEYEDMQMISQVQKLIKIKLENVQKNQNVQKRVASCLSHIFSFGPMNIILDYCVSTVRSVVINDYNLVREETEKLIVKSSDKSKNLLVIVTEQYEKPSYCDVVFLQPDPLLTNARHFRNKISGYTMSEFQSIINVCPSYVFLVLVRSNDSLYEMYWTAASWIS